MTRFDVRTPTGMPQGVPSRTPQASVVIAAAVLMISLLGMYGGAAMWVANTGAAHDAAVGRLSAANDATAAALARLEASTAERLARLESMTTERMARLESQANTRLDAFDKRGDSRMSQLMQKFDSSDKRDAELGADLNALNLRLTRLEAAREFINNNGTVAGAPGARR